MMEKTLKSSLIENVLLYLGLALMLGALTFWGLIDILLRYRKKSLTDEMLLMLQLVQDMGMVFIFAIGAAISFAGLLYTGVRAWQSFVALGNKEKHP